MEGMVLSQPVLRPMEKELKAKAKTIQGDPCETLTKCKQHWIWCPA